MSASTTWGSGQHEAVQRDHHQRAGIERLAVHAGRDLDADPDHADASQQVRDDQHPLAPPPVQEHPGERTDKGVGQQQYREAGGDIGGASLMGRVEQHRPGQ
jgi:hypothetical protein